MSELPGWDVLEDRSDERPPGRSRLILVAAAVPWLVVAVIALRPQGGAGVNVQPAPTPSATASTTATSTADHVPAVPDVAGAAEPVASPSGGLRIATAGLPETAGTAQAAGVALLVARAWLSQVGPSLDVGVGSAGIRAYVEQLQAEDVAWPAPGSAVVSLTGLLLESDGERYTRARPVRIAVPLRLDARGVRPAGAPWWLPPPDLTTDEPAWQPVDDPTVGAAAGGALAAAGYEEISVHAVETSDTWPLRVRATAIAPGATDASEHTVWLREHLGHLVVAGAPASEVSR